MDTTQIRSTTHKIVFQKQQQQNYIYLGLYI